MLHTLASREGRDSQENSLKPPHGIYKAFLESSILILRQKYLITLDEMNLNKMC